MSFAGYPGGTGGGGGGRTTGNQYYFCHSCNHSVQLPPPSSPSSDLVCPVCNGGFIEEIENPNPNPNPNPFFAFSGGGGGVGGSPVIPSLAGLGLPFLLSSSSSTLQNPTDLSALFGPDIRASNRSSFPTGGGGGGGGQEAADVFSPLMFLQNLISTSGANIEFIIENNPGDGDAAGGGGGVGIGLGGGGGGGFRMPANFGDYFIGPGFEQLIQQLAENDPNRYGTPPASKSAIETLLDVNISKEMLSSDSEETEQCAVCKDMFELGAKAKQMPCKHIYHPDCILPWLELHNSCPVCRYELPTDDPEYEQRIRENAAGGGGVSGGGGNVGASQESPRTAERRFRIPLRWPFRASPAETSGSGVGTNNEGGGSNSGNRENREFGSETRQEDLD